jgi:hypothetical protein
VEVLTREGGRCEIAWKDEKRGFVPCGLLGERPLTLEETIDSPYGNISVTNLSETLKANPRYSPPRAFWISPSVHTLFNAGRYFQQTLLSQKQKYLEEGRNENGEWIKGGNIPAPGLVRYPVPEFEAMKALLAKGFIAKSNWDQALPVWQETNCLDLANRSPDCPQMESSEGMPPLPEIRPSFFRDDRQVLAGNASIERISAHFGKVIRGRVMRGPTWLCSSGCCEPHYSGAWDIGTYEQALEEPIVEHVIGANGRVGAYQWLPQEAINGEKWFCGITRLTPRRGTTLLPGYSAIDEAVLWFQSPIALPLHKVTVSHRVGNENHPLRPIVYEIDLDNDGIPDFLKWDFRGDENFVFININGEWHVFEDDYDDQKDCC